MSDLDKALVICRQLKGTSLETDESAIRAINLGIVEGTSRLPCSFRSFRGFSALREVRGAFEDVAAEIAADEDSRI